jgi:hypothetical protein
MKLLSYEGHGKRLAVGAVGVLVCLAFLSALEHLLTRWAFFGVLCITILIGVFLMQWKGGLKPPS